MTKTKLSPEADALLIALIEAQFNSGIISQFDFDVCDELNEWAKEVTKD